MNTLRFATLSACALLCAATFAQGTAKPGAPAPGPATPQQTNKSFDTAQQAASQSGKGVVTLTHSNVPGAKVNTQKQWSEALTNDPNVLKSAGVFEVAHIDLYNQQARDTQNIDPVLSKRFGGPSTISVYAPGASRPFYTQQLMGDDKKPRGEFTTAQINDAMTGANQAWTKWRTDIDTLEARVKSNPNDIDARLALAQAYGKGYSNTKSREAYDETLRLIRTNDRADARLEALSLEAAQMEYDSQSYELARKNFTQFAADYPKSPQLGNAMIMSARSQALNGDVSGARTVLKRIIADDAMRAYHSSAQQALDEIEDMK